MEASGTTKVSEYSSSADAKDFAKEVARTRIFVALVQQAIVGKNPLVVRNQRDLRTKLGLEDIGNALFRRSLWHLDRGDRHYQGKRLIRVSRQSVDGRRKDLSVRVMGLPTRPLINIEPDGPTTQS